MQKNKLHHQHPAKILAYTTKFFWLLLIPLLRGLVAVKWDFATWVRGAWIDIATILLIFCFAYIKWYNIKYYFDNSGITIKNGIIFSHITAIPYQNITYFRVSRNYFLKVIDYTKVFIDTNSGSAKKADVILACRYKEAVYFSHCMNNFNMSQDIKSIYTPKTIHTLIFSLVFSNTLSGAILIATLIYQSGQYIGDVLEKKVVSTVTEATEKLSIGLPPAAVYLSLIILCGWSLSFILNFFRYCNYEASRKGPVINIKSGFVTKRFHQIFTSKINYIDFRQSLLTRLFKISSLLINCSGYGKAKRELSVLVPITTRNEVYSSVKMLLPEFKIPKITVKPGLHQMQRYIFFPIIYILIEPLIALVAMMLFPSWIEMIAFVLIIFEIPLIWLLIVKIIAKYTSGIGANTDFLILSYSFAYSYHTAIIPHDKITSILIRQSIFQKITNDCTLIIYTYSEHNKKHRVDHLPLNKVNELLKSIDYNKS